MKIHKSEKIEQVVDKIDAFWEMIEGKSWALWCTTYGYSECDDFFDTCIEFGSKIRNKSKVFRVDRGNHVYFFRGKEDRILKKLEKLKVEAEDY